MPHGGGSHSHSSGHSGGGGYSSYSTVYYGGSSYYGGSGGGGCNALSWIICAIFTAIIFVLMLWIFIPSNINYAVEMDPYETRFDYHFSSSRTRMYRQLSFGNYLPNLNVTAYLFHDYPRLNYSDRSIWQKEEGFNVGPSNFEYHNLYLPAASSVIVNWSLSFPLGFYVVADWQWSDWVDGDLSACLYKTWVQQGSLNFTSDESTEYYFVFDNSASGYTIAGNMSFIVTRIGFTLGDAIASCDLSTCGSMNLPFGSSQWLAFRSGSADMTYSFAYRTSHRFGFLFGLFGGITLVILAVPIVCLVGFLMCNKNDEYTRII